MYTVNNSEDIKIQAKNCFFYESKINWYFTNPSPQMNFLSLPASMRLA